MRFAGKPLWQLAGVLLLPLLLPRDTCSFVPPYIAKVCRQSSSNTRPSFPSQCKTNNADDVTHTKFTRDAWVQSLAAQVKKKKAVDSSLSTAVVEKFLLQATQRVPALQTETLAQVRALLAVGNQNTTDSGNTTCSGPEIETLANQVATELQNYTATLFAAEFRDDQEILRLLEQTFQVVFRALADDKEATSKTTATNHTAAAVRRALVEGVLEAAVERTAATLAHKIVESNGNNVVPVVATLPFQSPELLATTKADLVQSLHNDNALDVAPLLTKDQEHSILTAMVDSAVDLHARARPKEQQPVPNKVDD